ncbi:GPCR kinase [Parasponia andersonii]|uniref:non-specific serine/threonine protein kinase n=1 Tax=Parasponia andersonii TaxID=3476 RepID=A0A2P5DZD9_PARAD|nr:GPCR kinase [Parasponia andersonii]
MKQTLCQETYTLWIPEKCTEFLALFGADLVDDVCPERVGDSTTVGDSSSEVASNNAMLTYGYGCSNGIRKTSAFRVDLNKSLVCMSASHSQPPPDQIERQSYSSHPLVSLTVRIVESRMGLHHFTPIVFTFLCLILTATADEAAVMSKLLAAISPAPSGWSSSADYCTKWKGVNCSSSGRVTVINLANHSLIGTLPFNLTSLSELTSLSLQGNSLSGPLPSFANISSLQEIYLDGNNFTSVPLGCFQGLTSLVTLSMSLNSKLAPWNFPTELAGSSSLVTLSMGSCNMFGSIPDIFGSFPDLQDLRLSKNRLTGFLPPSFAGTGIRNLWLNSQQMGLSGTIDVLSNMTKLSQAWLQENQLTGPIPDLSKLDTLFDLQIRDNLFTGVVPGSLMLVSSLRNVSLSNNMLQGPLPLFPSSVTNVDLTGTNGFCKDTAGPCDAQVTTLLDVAKDLRYPIELANTWKGNNACNGWTYISCDSDGNVITVNFQKWHFTGTISPALANLTSLKNLLLNDNNLTGSIPDSLTLLPQLQVVDVSNNNLSGVIPRFPSWVKLTTTGNPLLRKSLSMNQGMNIAVIISVLFVIFKCYVKIMHMKLVTVVNHENGKQKSFGVVVIALIDMFLMLGNPENGKGGKSMLMAAVAATAAGIGALMIMLFFYLRKFSSNFLITFFWKNQNSAHRSIEDFLRNCGPVQVRRYSYSEAKKMTNSFKEKLGEGGFGSVYKGKLHDGSLVAVKVLNKSKANGEEFINEVATISRTSHVNIVSLLGFCFEGAKRALIYEFMPNGSLEKFVFEDTASESQNDHKLDWETHYQISLGIARGLEYLHRGCNTRILHFDIKPHNILLDADFVPKISDFGLAKICNRKESLISMLGLRGTVGYIAPEVFSRNFGGISYKSDVYSYGMMILEIVGGRKNVNVRVDNTSEIYFPHWVYKRLELDEELSLKRIADEEDRVKVRKMIIVSLWCIQTDPSIRPTMSKVIEMLEGSLESLQIPPKPFLSSPSISPPAESSCTSPPAESYSTFL